MISLFTFVAAIFGLIKSIFSIIEWLSADSEFDRMTRTYLDRLFEVLDTNRIDDLVQQFSQTVLTRFYYAPFVPRLRPVFIVAAVATIISTLATVSAVFQFQENPWGALIKAELMLSSLIAIIGNAVLCILSVIAFYPAVYLIARKISTPRICFVSAYLLLIVWSSYGLSFGLLLSADYWVRGVEGTMAAGFVHSSLSDMLYEFYSSPVLLTSAEFMAFAWITLVAVSYPALASFVIVVSMSLLRGKNSAARRIVSFLVFRVTTDGAPVFQSVGTISGLAGALIAGIAKLIV